MTQFHTNSPEETENVAKELAKTITGKAFLALYGDLGVGKTSFVRGLASVLAPEGKVKSPTFTIVNEYRGGKEKFYHLDVYRISDEDELYNIGFYDYVKNGILVCEWSENIPYAIPTDAIRITITKTDTETGRDIVIEGGALK